MKLVGGLMTGVGEVEHIVGLLGVEHHGVLVAALPDIHKLPAGALFLLCYPLGVLLLLTVCLGEFCAQDTECLCEVFLLEYGP